MFRPTGRRDIAMDVARLQPDPIHGRKMSNRIRDVRVHHELGLRRRTRREVELHRIAGPCFPVWLKLRRSAVPIFIPMPIGYRATDNNAGAMFSQEVKPRYAICGTYDVPHTPSFNSVGEIVSAQKGRCWQDDGTKFDEGQNCVPKGENISKHHHDAIAASDAQFTIIVRYLR